MDAVIDCLTEDFASAVSLTCAAKWFPKSRTGKTVHVSVLARWADKGVNGPAGNRVVLRTTRVGGRRLTTESAVRDFIRELNAPAEPRQKADPSASAKRALEAGRALEKLGC